MNRLQKKCFIATSGCHLLLAVILLIGPGFLSSKTKTQDPPTIEILPLITTDADVSGGGDPKGGQPPPAPPAQPVKPSPVPPAPAPVREEEKPKPEPVKPEKAKETTPPDDTPPPKESAESPEARKKPRHKIEVSTTPVQRNPNEQSAAKARAAAEAKEAAARSRRIAAAIRSAANNLAGNFSGETSIVLNKGPGGGGVPYGNWLSAIKKIYTDAWVIPTGVTDDSATVTASVTIARDGEVLSTRIVRPSGNSLVDHSVQAALDRVPHAAPLPDGAKESERTVTINFNVKAKQSLG